MLSFVGVSPQGQGVNFCSGIAHSSHYPALGPLDKPLTEGEAKRFSAGGSEELLLRGALQHYFVVDIHIGWLNSRVSVGGSASGGRKPSRILPRLGAYSFPNLRRLYPIESCLDGFKSVVL